VGARLVGEGWVLLGDVRLERAQLRLPRVSDVVGTPGMPSEHVAEALSRQPLGPLLIEEVPLQGPDAPQFGNLGCGKRRNIMAPVRGQGFDLLALEQAPIANAGARGDTEPALQLCNLRRHGAGRVGMAREHCARDRRPVLVAE
jgi:hypothetical protein